MQRTALAQMRDVLGEQHPDTLTLSNNYAITLTCMDRIDEAKELLNKVISIRTTELGEYHEETLSALSNLADCFAASSDSVNHRSLRELIHKNALSAFGGEHPDTLQAMTSLSIVRWEVGD